MTPDFDWSSHLRAALEATEFMALATHDQNGLWNHAVYFSYDRELNLYFISQPDSRHMQNIASNNEAALAIFSTDQVPTKDVVGLQIQGTATVLTDDQVPFAHKIYYARSPEIPGISADLKAYLGENTPWKFVKITPTEIGYFDTANFGDKRQIVPQGVQL